MGGLSAKWFWARKTLPPLPFTFGIDINETEIFPPPECQDLVLAVSTLKIAIHKKSNDTYPLDLQNPRAALPPTQRGRRAHQVAEAAPRVGSLLLSMGPQHDGVQGEWLLRAPAYTSGRRSVQTQQTPAQRIRGLQTSQGGIRQGVGLEQKECHLNIHRLGQQVVTPARDCSEFSREQKVLEYCHLPCNGSGIQEHEPAM